MSSEEHKGRSRLLNLARLGATITTTIVISLRGIAKDDVPRLAMIIQSSVAEIMDCFMGMEAQTRERQQLISNKDRR